MPHKVVTLPITNPEAMRQRTNRQSTVPRTVISLSMPIEPDWVNANRAAGMSGGSLAEFIREATRQRVAKTLTDEPPRLRAA